jgi:hypothetical protein
MLPKITITLEDVSMTGTTQDRKGRFIGIWTNAKTFSITQKHISTTGLNSGSHVTSYEFPSRLEIILNKKTVCDQIISRFCLKCKAGKITIVITPSPQGKTAKIPQ